VEVAAEEARSDASEGSKEPERGKPANRGLDGRTLGLLVNALAKGKVYTPLSPFFKKV
jgi:hypothetical protein